MEEVDKPSLLVTGGTGFIGSYLVKAAIKRGWSVTSVSKHPPLEDRFFQDVTYIQCDLTDKSCVKFLVKDGFDYVVNLGGYIDHTRFKDGGRDLIESHFIGVMNLVQYLPRSKLKRFIQVGSSDEYGDVESPQEESFREQPISPYSLGKACSTHFLQMMNRVENFPSVIVRLFLTYGPGQNMQRFLPQVIAGCLKNESFAVSAGEQIRDFCFVEDVIEAIFRALTNNNAEGEVFNIASGAPVSVRSMIELIHSCIGMGEPQFGEVPYRAGENMKLYANTTKAYDLLGWKPDTSLIKGVERTVEWYRARDQDSF
jgi:nucleoside-diphosphate-sugar epimerase